MRRRLVKAPQIESECNPESSIRGAEYSHDDGFKQ
jgi:hypothetical protein